MRDRVRDRDRVREREREREMGEFGRRHLLRWRSADWDRQ